MGQGVGAFLYLVTVVIARLFAYESRGCKCLWPAILQSRWSFWMTAHFLRYREQILTVQREPLVMRTWSASSGAFAC